MDRTSRTKKVAVRPSPRKTTTRTKTPKASTPAKKPPKAQGAAKKPTTARAVKAVRAAAVTTAATIAPRAPRRVIFIDVENTSSEAALLHVLDHLAVDRTVQLTEVIAIGNWKSVGTKVARTLASLGAQLVHSAPLPGVRDWSDLWIAVNAGRWLAHAAPGDRLDLVSDDRAFDAVRDAAASLGVLCNRISYRHLPGAASVTHATPTAAPEERPRRPRRRGGRGRRPAATHQPQASHATAPSTPTAAEPAERAPAAGEAGAAHAASQEQIRAILARLTGGDSTRWINLDLLANALKAEGFSRPPGSPRLITRVRSIKGVELNPNGMVRLVGAAGAISTEAASPSDDAAPAPLAARRPRRRGGRRHRRRPAAAAANATAPLGDDETSADTAATSSDEP